MLFDLNSSRRRRNVVKVIYAMLALLLGGGLIFFGIGSSATGGLSEIFGGGGSSDTGFEQDIKDAQATLVSKPGDQKALTDLVQLEAQQGNKLLGFDESTGSPVLTTEAEDSYNKAADYWAEYLALKPKKPDPGAALQISLVYFTLAQSGADSYTAIRADIEKTADAQQIVADDDPSAGNLKNLAFYLYFAGRADEATKVSAQALAAAQDDTEREAIRSELKQAAKNSEVFQKQLDKEKKGAQADPGANPLAPGAGGLGGGSNALGQ